MRVYFLLTSSRPGKAGLVVLLLLDPCFRVLDPGAGFSRQMSGIGFSSYLEVYFDL